MNNINYIYYFIFISYFFLLGCDNSDNPKTIDFSNRVHDSVKVHKTDEQHKEELIRFGFDLRSSVQEDAKQYQPLLNYLENKTGLHFHMVLTKKNDKLHDKLGTGELDIAAIGAVTHIKAQEAYGVTPLVRGLNKQNKAEYQSVIVVHPDSQIKDISHLTGKQMAFGHVNSTQGHLIPRIELISKGIKLTSFSQYDYFGSHRECANMVISKQFDACGMQDTMGLELARKGLLNVIHTSSFYPSSGISASPKLKPELRMKIKKALLEFNPKGVDKELYNWDLTEMPNGFKSSSKQDYKSFRNSMIRLGMLPPRE